MEMHEEHTKQEHIKNPMHYVAGGHRRAAGLIRVDKINAWIPSDVSICHTMLPPGAVPKDTHP